MKTLVDWLTEPCFRKSPAMYLGRGDLWTLQTWMDGYIRACEDADNIRQISTPNGVPMTFFRDYVAMQEKGIYMGDLYHTLMYACGEERDALNRFFTRLDEFLRLSVLSVWCMTVTEKMKKTYMEKCQPQRKKPDGSWEPAELRLTALRKTALSEGFCWMTEERPEGEQTYRAGPFKLMKESYADQCIQSEYGELNWKIYTGK